ncbi:MAG: DNA methyltransferase [Candidatus Binataceae bacterium]
MGDIVLDPFSGSGTAGQVCERLGRRWVGLELSEDCIKIARKRTAQIGLVLRSGSPLDDEEVARYVHLLKSPAPRSRPARK